MTGTSTGDHCSSARMARARPGRALANYIGLVFRHVGAERAQASAIPTGELARSVRAGRITEIERLEGHHASIIWSVASSRDLQSYLCPRPAPSCWPGIVTAGLAQLGPGK